MYIFIFICRYIVLLILTFFLTCFQNVLSREHLELPLMLEETIHELSNEDDDSGRYNLPHKNLTKYSHSSTL